MPKKPKKDEAVGKVVEWKRGYRYSHLADPVEVDAEFEKIRAVNDGELTPPMVVEAAKKRRSPLRKFFNWNDAEAANEHRLEKARLMIRSIQVFRPEMPNQSTRKYEMCRSSFTGGNTYKPVEDILSDPEAKAELLKRAMGELLAFQRRFRGLQELAVIFRSINETLEKIKV